MLDYILFQMQKLEEQDIKPRVLILGSSFYDRLLESRGGEYNTCKHIDTYMGMKVVVDSDPVRIPEVL